MFFEVKKKRNIIDINLYFTFFCHADFRFLSKAEESNIDFTKKSAPVPKYISVVLK